MAEHDEPDTDAPVDEPTQGGGLLKPILMGVAALALLGAGIFAGPAVQGLLDGGGDAAVEDEPVAEVVEVPEEDRGPELYQGLHPALVVNFRDSLGDAHFMQIEMEVMSRNQDVINAVREHTPLIRNNLILMYGSVMYEEVTTRQGKEKMLADALAEIQGIMAKRVGTPNVEAVYFTSLIIQ